MSPRRWKKALRISSPTGWVSHAARVWSGLSNGQGGSIVSGEQSTGRTRRDGVASRQHSSLLPGPVPGHRPWTAFCRIGQHGSGDSTHVDSGRCCSIAMSKGILTDLTVGLSHLWPSTPHTAVAGILLSPRLLGSSPHVGRVLSPSRHLWEAPGLPCC